MRSALGGLDTNAMTSTSDLQAKEAEKMMDAVRE
jgi:hypothetical protein